MEATKTVNKTGGVVAVGSSDLLDALLKTRKRLGMTQAEFAGEYGLSLDTIKSWECGRSKISPLSALRLSIKTGVNISAGKTTPVTVKKLLAPLLGEYDRKLRIRLGV